MNDCRECGETYSSLSSCPLCGFSPLALPANGDAIDAKLDQFVSNASGIGEINKRIDYLIHCKDSYERWQGKAMKKRRSLFSWLGRVAPPPITYAEYDIAATELGKLLNRAMKYQSSR